MPVADVDVGNSIQTFLNEVFGFLPNLIGALLILVIGWFVARLVGSLVARALQRGGLDDALSKGRTGTLVANVTESPSRLIGRVAYWFLLIGAFALAVSALGIDALTGFMGVVFGYLPNVIAALAIFVVAGLVAAGVGALLARTMGGKPTGQGVGPVVPGALVGVRGLLVPEPPRVAP